MSYQAFIYTKEKYNIDTGKVIDTLKNFKCDVNNQTINIHVGEYRFSITINDNPEVNSESLELIHQNKLPKDIQTNIRLELSGDEDINMDYFNDYIFITTTLTDKGYIVYDLAGEEVMSGS